MAVTQPWGLAGANYPKWAPEEVTTGTTIMAVEFDGGVVIGADSRTSSGIMVVNRVTDKLTKITDKIYCCRSGSAAHTQFIADYVAHIIDLHSINVGEAPRVKTAASLFRKLCYYNRDYVVAGIICAGWDPVEGGQVYSIPLGGMYVRQPFSIGGSGSTYLYGYCDANFKEGMSREQCQEFVKNSVALAISRDGSSGGVIRIATIDESGIERKVFTGNDIPTFYDSGVPSDKPGLTNTDGKQLPSVTMSKTYPDKPLVPISEEGGAATPHHDDPTPPTSADTPTDTSARFSIDSHPTLKDINQFVLREVAADWKQVALFLGVEPSVIRIADTDHPRRCEDACTDIFERWLSWGPGTGERERTWRTVLSVVEEVGYKALSHQLQTEVLHLQ